MQSHMERLDIFYKKGIHKVWGLKQLSRNGKFKSRTSWPFGDSEMMKCRTIGFTMENADPRVKTVANHLAPANTEAAS